MSLSTGLLIVSNIKQIGCSLHAIEKYVKKLYIHLNIPSSLICHKAPVWGKVIRQLYYDSYQQTPGIALRIIVTTLKMPQVIPEIRSIDMIFSDSHDPETCDPIREKLKIPKDTIYLNEKSEKGVNSASDWSEQVSFNEEQKTYSSVVLGGTFDRIHLGHKILLTEAVLRACNRLVVGVTDTNMVQSKILPELILPVEQRIREVKEFLTEIDSTLLYDIVAIQDPFGPTQYDPNMDMIIVSTETFKGGCKVNEIRKENKLPPLEIFSIDLVNSPGSLSGPKEKKFSSSNARIDMLGTRIRPKPNRDYLPQKPYVVGLTGGIASGKTLMAKIFKEFGAFILDCDRIAHEVYEPGKKCYEKLIEEFGVEILDCNKRIDRIKLGSIVFSDAEKLDILNRIVWPETLVECKRKMQEAYEKLKVKVIIFEAAVLLKAGWEAECHEVWSMIIPVDQAVARLAARNNFSKEEALKRISSQLSNASFVENSNVVFSSAWSTEFTKSQAEKAWNMLMKEIDSD